MLFSGKTLVLFAKLKSLVEKDRKIVFISCLLPYEDVSPMYELIMRKKIEEFGDNIRFYSAMDICSEMDVTDRERSSYEMGVRIENYAMDICSEMGVILGKTEREKSFYSVLVKSFYSVLAKFIQNLPEEFNTLLIDEFGDSLDKLAVEDKEEMLRVTGSLAGIEGKHLIISLHPRCEIDVSKLKDQGYEISEMKYIMRNTASIWKYDKTLSSSESDSWTSTVFGLQPVYISGSEENDFYNKIVEAVCIKKSRKFVCLIPDESDRPTYNNDQFQAELERRGIETFKYLKVGDEKNLDMLTYDDNQFKAELGRRGIETFEYLKVGDEKNLDKFLESQEGCLITRYEHARGTECTTLLVFKNKQTSDSRRLRGTTHLVDAQLDINNLHFSVGEPEPGYILIQGNKLDPIVYSSLVDKMLEKSVERYILIQDYLFGELFLNELESRRLPLPVEKTPIPRSSLYSVEDIKTHLQENISGGIMYYTGDIEDDCLKWIGAEVKIPIIYKETLTTGKETAIEEVVDHIRKGNPSLFIYVKVRE